MSDQPNWESHFPIRQNEEHKTSRRQFGKFLGCALLAGAGLAATRKFLPSANSGTTFVVAEINELNVGSSKLFRDPKTDAPGILIRLSEQRYVAYSQSCTHLMCPVHFDGKKNELVCPCHQGFFSAEDGRVLGGPPPRPLPRFPVEIRDGRVWVRTTPQTGSDSNPGAS